MASKATFNRKFILSGFWISSRYAILAVLGIVTTAAFARLGSKELLGQYQFIIAILALFSIFSLPGLNIAALKAVAQKRPRAVIEAVRRSFRSSLFALPILFSYAAYLFFQGQVELALVVAVSSIIFPFYYAPNTWYTLYEGQANFYPVAIRTVATSFFATFGLVAGLYFHIGLLPLVAIFLGTSAVFSGIFYIESKNHIIKIDSGKSGTILDLGYGHRVTAQKFVYTLSESLPPVVVSLFLGHQAVALFQVANVFLVGVAGLIGALAVISLPRFFVKAKSNHKDVFWQNTILGLIACACYFVTVKIIFLPIYGQDYQESLILAKSLSLLPLIISLRTFLVNYLTARDKNSVIISVYLIANVLAFIIFGLATLHLGFVNSAVLYLYALNLLICLPLGAFYFFTYNSKAGERKN